MIPQHWIEAYLRLLLRRKRTVAVLVALVTVFFAWQLRSLRMHTDFRDFYPRFRTVADAYEDCRAQGRKSVPGCAVDAVLHPGPDPYVQIYTDFREMFGTPNILSVILEVTNGDVFNPVTLQKLDRITQWVLATKGVNPQQVLSIAHPRVRSITNQAGAIEIREIFHPGVPTTPADAERVRFAVYSTPGIRGVLTALDDRAAVVHAGFWEEALDYRELHRRMSELKAAEEDAHHVVHVTGLPWLYTSVLRYAPQLVLVLLAFAASTVFLLYVYFRTWTGIWVPVFTALLSTVWGLGIAVLLGFNLDPLVLVIPVFLTARALSHSVQSMDRYHEEYHRWGDKNRAIVESYSHLFPPAIASIVTDGIGLLIVAVAPIPLIQKVAIFASFWIVSIFVSVVTLHPIVLAYTNPPPRNRAVPRASLAVRPAALFTFLSGLTALAVRSSGLVSGTVALLLWLPVLAWFWWMHAEKIYAAVTRAVILASEGAGRWIVIGLTILLFVAAAGQARLLRVGDMTPGAALLFPEHPYNVAYKKLNASFLGASQLLVIADTGRPDGIKDAEALAVIEEFADHMQEAPGASRSITVVEIIKRLARLYRDGDPKWALIPDDPKEIGQYFYVFTSAAAAGDLDRFLDPSGRYGTVLTLFRGYSNEIIQESIAHGRRFAASLAGQGVDFRFAGGLFGILAAVNSAVESSYWTNLVLIFAIVYVCLVLTYGSPVAAAILMIPVILSQVVAEALMVLMEIDLNVNSLPIAAAGAGVGVDYGIYHFSRMIDTYDEIGNLDEAVDYATATTGKAIIFTASTMIAGTVFWWFSSLKFQAEMGFLLALLMLFNTFGGLVVVPAFVKVLRPSFLVGRRRPAQTTAPVSTDSR